MFYPLSQVSHCQRKTLQISKRTGGAWIFWNLLVGHQYALTCSLLYTDRHRSDYRYACIRWLAYTHSFLALSLRLRGSSDTPKVPSRPVPSLGALIPFLKEKNQGSLEKWLILGLGQRKYNMSLEHLTVPESK